MEIERKTWLEQAGSPELFGKEMEIKQHVEPDLAKSLLRKSHAIRHSPFRPLIICIIPAIRFSWIAGLIKLGNVKLSVKIEMVHLINARVSLRRMMPFGPANI